MLDTGLDNELLADPDLNLGDFNSSSVNGIDLSAINDDKPPPVVEGEDGNLYRSNAYYTPSGWKTDPDFSEPVYYYTQGVELGEAYDWRFEDNEDGSITQSGSFFTESQIREFWEADEGMGYFKQEHSHMDFDTYMSFLKESSSLHMDGFFTTPQEDGYAFPEPDAEAHQALLNKYGIKTTYQNDDGDVFQFNGSNYTKTSKVDDGFDAGGLIMSLAVGYMTGGLLGNPLTALLGQAGITGSAAVAATNAITNMATQLVTTGSIDMKQALISAAVSYGGDKLGNAFANSAELDGVLGDIATTAQESVTKFNDLISTGNSVVDAAIQAGGIDMLSQLVINGKVDLEQAATSALVAAGTEGFKKLNTLTQAGGGGSVELEEIVVTAKRKGTDLGDGLYELNGVVFSTNQGDNYGYLGSMADIDTDGDGVISANDLQEITTNNQYVPSSINPEGPFQKDGARVYLDSEGNVYTQDQVGRYVDGSQYGDIYMVNGQELLLEQGTMINGRMMFDGDGDGVFDVVYNDKGKVVGSYNSETKEWEDANGNTSTAIGDYMRQVNPTSGGSGIENPFDISREAYEAMTGEEYVKDLFALKASPGGTGRDGMLLALDDGEIAEMVARFEKHPYTTSTGEVLYGVEALEQYLQDQGIGVNYSAQAGWRLEAGVDTTDGIYGDVTDFANVGDFLGAPDTTKDTTIRTIADIDTAVPIDKDPFTDPVDPEDTSDEPGGNNTPSTSTNNGTSQNTSTSDSNAATTAEDFTLTQIRTIANATGTTVQSVINALDEGKSPQEILAANDVSPSTSASDLANSSDGDNSTATDTTTDKTSDGTDGTSTSGTTTTGSTAGTTPGNTAVGVTPGQEVIGPTTFSVGPSVWNTGGDQSGSGTNEGEGEGEGEGDGEGDGSGLGTGGGGKGGNAARGSYTPQWGPLFATNKFRKFNKDRGNGMMAPLQQNTSLSAPKVDFSQSRLNLFSDLIKDLK